MPVILYSQPTYLSIVVFQHYSPTGTSSNRHISTNQKQKDQQQHFKILPSVLKPFISSLLTAIPILPSTSTRLSPHAPSLGTYPHCTFFPYGIHSAQTQPNPSQGLSAYMRYKLSCPHHSLLSL